ncbi:MAG: hypothetical protein DRH97_01885 [Chloroflexi bacterium]|nr:MAG: hypothetical protein DRH97_01885 [Chloroflexota bacterium]
MENKELIERAARIIMDSSYTHPVVLAKLNKGTGRIATLAELPDLRTSATVQTGSDPYVVLPATAVNAFHVGKEKALFFVASQGQDREINIIESWIKFLQKYPRMDEASDIYDVCVRGDRLYYQGIPSTADTLDLHYYRKPVAMKDNTKDGPDGIPEHLQEDLLVSFVCWDAFKEIEDDETGKTPNTDKYERLFGIALAELKTFVGLPDARPIHYEYDEGNLI